MTDLKYTQYRLAVALTMPAGTERDVRMASVLYRLAVLTGVIL